MSKHKTKKVLIQWIEVDANGNPSFQIRKYNDVDKADQFIEKLCERGIATCTKKEVLDLNEPAPGQLAMDI